jgi:hypothetical protein
MAADDLPPAEATTATNKDQQDEDRLAQFGYKQELKRDWGLTHNFGVSFSIIVGFPILCVITRSPAILNEMRKKIKIQTNQIHRVSSPE